MRKYVSIAAIATALISYPAAAQTPDNPIDYCRDNAADKNARIACLEAAITGLMSRSASPDTEAMAAAAASKQSAQAAEDSDEDTPPEAPSVAVAEAPEAAQGPEKPTGLGAEQVEKRVRSAATAEERKQADQDRPRVEAAVIQFATTPLGKAIFILDNGQVWRQKRSDRNRVKLRDSRNYTVTVREGMLSGYRLTVHELKKTILVERIK